MATADTDSVSPDDADREEAPTDVSLSLGVQQRMSTTQPAGIDTPVPTDESHDDPDIVQEFRDRLLARYPDADDVSAALRRAEQEPSTTDRTDMGRCPACGSVRLQEKSASVAVAQQKDGDYRCTQCRHHFETPIKQTTWEAWR